MSKKKIIFFGTPNFAVPFLESLNNSNLFEIAAVICEPDRPSGRKQKIVFSPVKSYCLKNSLLLLQPQRVLEIKDDILSVNADISVVVAYGQIIPNSIVTMPKHGTINVHPSDLPHYRGPSPIQTALLNGDKQTAVTIMKMDEKMDHGPILAKQTISIDDNDDYTLLEQKILESSPALLIDTLEKYLADKVTPIDQDDELASYCKMIKKEDGLIDWNLPALNIHNKIRAYSLWPRAYTIVDNRRLIFIKSKFTSGKIQPILVQLEGKKPISWDNFINNIKNPLPKQLTDKIC